MKGIFLICLFNLMVTEAVIAANSRFTYLLKGYPKEQSDCLPLATALGEKFHQATNLEVDLAKCTAETTDSFDIQIEYFSDARVPVVTTWPRGTGVYLNGRFTSRKECENILAADKEEFQRQTGLFPTFAYCFNSDRVDYNFPDSSRADKTWAPKIEAFGKSAISYRLDGFALFTLPKDPKSMQLRAKLDDGLKQKNAKFMDVVVQSHGAYADVVVHYYGEQRLNFDMYEDIRTNSFDECEAQRAEIEAMFKSSENPSVLSFCGSPMIASQIEQDILFIGGNPYRSLDTTESFKTFAECRSQLSGLIAKYTAQTKKTFAGGACSQKESDKLYRGKLFYK